MANNETKRAATLQKIVNGVVVDSFTVPPDLSSVEDLEELTGGDITTSEATQLLPTLEITDNACCEQDTVVLDAPTDVLDTTLTLNWHTLANTADYFIVQVSELNDFSVLLVDQQTNDYSIDLTGLTVNTVYYYRVRCFDCDAFGDWVAGNVTTVSTDVYVYSIHLRGEQTWGSLESTGAQTINSVVNFRSWGDTVTYKYSAAHSVTKATWDGIGAISFGDLQTAVAGAAGDFSIYVEVVGYTNAHEDAVIGFYVVAPSESTAFTYTYTGISQMVMVLSDSYAVADNFASETSANGTPYYGLIPSTGTYNPNYLSYNSIASLNAAINALSGSPYVILLGYDYTSGLITGSLTMTY